MKQKHLNTVRSRRASRTRVKIRGTEDRPRLSIFRSNKYIYLQLINDVSGRTILSVSSFGLKGRGKGVKKSDQARELGKMLAEKAKTAGLETVVLDRGAYRYHGRVKAVADAARERGLKL
ncbi:MAG: 50S ribosomal protein L18 [Candidatus Colwellbacteria bacterium CG_4_9_14_0_2_um_filter_50_12]|uniref:Large ribosomal subunit protein uL18 n=1 Tax=Candidatus Colwellbacteria bacterium CG_4_9_14_0_2_um_filter_50_12 TaxID=1974538 RepID=A0A2M8G146_9BACT|nr:MAG: 50S ribosomal protein L18 [Candidatus Colwellbacteria bacterium CG_4_9_14_0_2_um_filter_50_12]